MPSPTFTLVQSYATPRMAGGAFRPLSPARAVRAGRAGPRGGAEGRHRASSNGRSGPASCCRRAGSRSRLDDNGGGASAARDAARPRRLGSAPRPLRRHARARSPTAGDGASCTTCRAMPRRAATARLVRGARPSVIADGLAAPAGRPAIRDGMPYSRIAHLAEDVRPFVAVASALHAAGLTAPRIHAQDLDNGLLLLEDLGDRVFGREVADRRRRSGDAVARGGRCARRAAATPRRRKRCPSTATACTTSPPTIAAPWRSRPSCWSTGIGPPCAAPPCRQPSAPSSSPCGPMSSTAAGANARRLGAARLPLAQSSVAAGARRHCARRHHRLPGCHARPRRLRPRLTPAGCARRCGTRA